MSVSRIVFLALAFMLGSPGFAQDDKTPERIVREYAAAWNAGDLAAFLGLQSPDVRKYRRADVTTSEFQLTTTGREEVRRKYLPLFAKTPRVRVEIVSMTSLGEIVVARDHVSAADGHVSHELTMYQVREGLIHNIWYLGRVIE